MVSNVYALKPDVWPPSLSQAMDGYMAMLLRVTAMSEEMDRLQSRMNALETSISGDKWIESKYSESAQASPSQTGKRKR